MEIVLMTLIAIAGALAAAVIYELCDLYRTMVSSTRGYRLWKFTTKHRTGMVVVVNQRGFLWVEVKHTGKTTHKFNIIQGAQFA